MVRSIIAFRIPFEDSCEILGGEKVYTCACARYFYVYCGRFHKKTEVFDIDWKRLKIARERYRGSFPFGIYEISRSLGEDGCTCGSSYMTDEGHLTVVVESDTESDFDVDSELEEMFRTIDNLCEDCNCCTSTQSNGCKSLDYANICQDCWDAVERHCSIPKEKQSEQLRRAKSEEPENSDSECIGICRDCYDELRAQGNCESVDATSSENSDDCINICRGCYNDLLESHNLQDLHESCTSENSDDCINICRGCYDDLVGPQELGLSDDTENSENTNGFICQDCYDELEDCSSSDESDCVYICYDCYGKLIGYKVDDVNDVNDGTSSSESDEILCVCEDCFSKLMHRKSDAGNDSNENDSTTTSSSRSGDNEDADLVISDWDSDVTESRWNMISSDVEESTSDVEESTSDVEESTSDVEESTTDIVETEESTTEEIESSSDTDVVETEESTGAEDSTKKFIQVHEDSTSSDNVGLSTPERHGYVLMDDTDELDEVEDIETRLCQPLLRNDSSGGSDDLNGSWQYEGDSLPSGVSKDALDHDLDTIEIERDLHFEWLDKEKEYEAFWEDQEFWGNINRMSEAHQSVDLNDSLDRELERLLMELQQGK